MPRIAFVIHAWRPADGFGGPVTKLGRLLSPLQRAGIEPEIWTTTLSAPSRPDLPPGRTTVDGVPVRRFATPVARGWSACVALPRDLAIPDGLHIFGAWSGISYECAWWARRRGLPVVWEPCGMLVEAGRRRRLKRWLRPLHRWMAANAVISWTSRREAAEAAIDAPRSWLRPNPVVAPPDGIPSRAAARRRLAWPETGPVFGYLGRIARRKGIERLLDVWPGSRAGRLVFTGPVEDSELAARIDRTGNGVIRTGPVAHDDIWTWLRAIDALVLVPDYGENFGNVVAEAVAVGTPAIVSTAVGAAEWLADAGVVIVDDDAGLRRALLSPDALPAARLPAELRAEEVGRRLAAQWRDLLA